MTKNNTLNQMWATRPVRLPKKQGGDAHIAGVCEGIAVRYQVDPTLVRVAFVVAALAFGGGIAAYLTAWALMPRFGSPYCPLDAALGKDGVKEEQELGWILIVGVLLTFSSGPLLLSGQSLAGLPPAVLTFGLLALAWYALHQREPLPPSGLLATEQPVREEPVDLTSYTPADGHPFPPGRAAPPSWDPLGVVPEAWDLPEPGPREEPTKKRGSQWAEGAIALGAVGVALTIAFLGVTFVTEADDESGFSARFNVGSQHIAPTHEDELEDYYDLGIGTSTVDLSQIKELKTKHDVTIDIGIGSVEVILPKDIPVSLTCDGGLGESNCTDRHDPGALLNIRIDQGIGELTVTG
ncbi:PspC domain-containing protein [Corynebacterium singulare]|uniref:PspC domain-containing protein n=1 Tax=Corynebacterium singulare TaxID=161899 RepID=A0ABS9PW39_9CORY|nr:PspC domain-containing protein [Corynebacterium singulare]MCG7276184.1 PspC domain-containing protein [Corynebacterium singulare]